MPDIPDNESLKDKISRELTPEERETLQEPLGATGRPYPMREGLAVEPDDTTPPVVKSDVPYLEVLRQQDRETFKKFLDSKGNKPLKPPQP